MTLGSTNVKRTSGIYAPNPLGLRLLDYVLNEDLPIPVAFHLSD